LAIQTNRENIEIDHVPYMSLLRILGYAGGMDYDDFPEPEFIDFEEPPRRIWTLRRIMMLIIALVVILVFLTVFYIAPLITADRVAHLPHVTPTVLPRF
jgi:hypothetical protein